MPDPEKLLAIAQDIAADLPNSLDQQSWREIFEMMIERIVINAHDVVVMWRPEFEAIMTVGNTD